MSGEHDGTGGARKGAVGMRWKVSEGEVGGEGGEGGGGDERGGRRGRRGGGGGGGGGGEGGGFFFSGRRRHTRSHCDWSSDVCSSDLVARLLPRFYDVSSGAVLVDGIDVRDRKLSGLRDAASQVPDEAFFC